LKRTAPESPQRSAAASTNSNAQASAPNNPPASSNTSPTATTPTAPTVTPGEPLVVKFEATVDDCAVRYWIDDAPKPADVTIKKGESQTLPPAQNQVRLSIGNRPAVRMSINNREARFPEGTPNWGAKVTVSHDNLQTFFQ